MKRILVLATITLMALAPAGLLLAQDATEEPASTNPTVLVRQDPTHGSYLADSAGMTLYMFTKDTVPNESTCYDTCATNWPPFTGSEPLTLPLEVEGKLTMVKRTDGTSQVAYNGMPLYYYAGDKVAGDINGQGVGGVWWVVAPGSQMGGTPTAVQTPSDSGTPMAAGNVDVSLTDYSVQASAVTLQVGQEYTFVISNDGATVHELLIEPSGANDKPLEANGQEAEAEDIQPGASATLTWTFTEAGNYQLACHVSGHYPAGMSLNIKVVG